MHDAPPRRGRPRMHYFKALATDYDGTIAHDGIVDEATLDAVVGQSEIALSNSERKSSTSRLGR